MRAAPLAPYTGCSATGTPEPEVLWAAKGTGVPELARYLVHISRSGPGPALTVLGTALLLAACTDLGASGRRLPLNFRVAPVDDEAGFSAEAGAGVIIVRDRVLTGECHRREVHRARLRGDTVMLRIEHPRKRGSCHDIGIAFGYEARIGGLAPGAYVLRVEYAGEVSSETEPGQAVERHVVIR